MLEGPSILLPTVFYFLQANRDYCVIDGVIDGLSEGKHGLHINELGDLSVGCNR